MILQKSLTRKKSNEKMVRTKKLLLCFSFFFMNSLFVYGQHETADSSQTLITVPGKTGTPLLINGKILGSDGNPIEGADLWIYHTDSEGYYAKSESGGDKGWRYADYSARLKSGPDGTFEIQTIRPAGYPNSINPAHLHIRINVPGYPELEYTAYFEGGDRITSEIKDLVDRYGTMFLLPVDTSNDGLQTVSWHIKLLKNSPY